MFVCSFLSGFDFGNLTQSSATLPVVCTRTEPGFMWMKHGCEQALCMRTGYVMYNAMSIVHDVNKY